MFPRDGKRDGFSEWPLIPAKRRADGGHQVPVAVLLANAPRPNGQGSVLLDLDDVTTLFHEFAHVLHELVGQGDYALFSGTNVEPDFAEAPSVMMESFVTDGHVLKEIARDPADPTKPFPMDVVAQLKKSHAYSSRLEDKRQLALAKINMAVHTNGEGRRRS